VVGNSTDWLIHGLDGFVDVELEFYAFELAYASCEKARVLTFYRFGKVVVLG
jgi:hypothetical protein